MQKVAAKPKTTTPKPAPRAQAPKAKRKAAPQKKSSPLSAVGRAAANVAKQRFAPLVNGAKQATAALKAKVNPPLSDKERGAAKFMEKMLGKDKLGGANEKFGHEDMDAVLKGLGSGFRATAVRAFAKPALGKALEENGVLNKPDQKPDATPRTVSKRELQAFGAAGKILEGRGAILDKLGLKLAFPDGIPKAAFTHMLQGKGGLPPGAQLIQKTPPPEK